MGTKTKCYYSVKNPVIYIFRVSLLCGARGCVFIFKNEVWNPCEFKREMWMGLCVQDEGV